MPIEAFDAIKENIQTFLGGARVDLVSSREGESREAEIREIVIL